MITTMIVNVMGLALIAIIVWWFWLTDSDKSVKASDVIEVTVDGGVYKPAIIEAAPGQTLHLRFHRYDTSSCAQYVIFHELNLSEQLPTNQPYTIELTLPDKTGEYEFTCQMGMYRGRIDVDSDY
jgi:plastocyanin domain-containing protein